MFLIPFTLFFLAITTLATPAAGTGGNINVGLFLQGGPDGTKEGTENALALQGLKEACLPSLPTSSGYQYNSCTPRIYTPPSETLGAYSGLIPAKTGENDFMIALGYFPSKAIQTAAGANGDKLFAIVDFEFTPPESNIASVMISEDQIGFLAGLLAGEVAKSRGGKVAGMELFFPPICDMLGFWCGCGCVCDDDD
jgi:basic membrane protein A